MSTLTLSTLMAQLDDLEARFGNEPIDTHIFATDRNVEILRRLAQPEKRYAGLADFNYALDSIGGLSIWNDLTVPENEIHIGRVKWKDGKPDKIVTRVIQIDA